MLLPTDVQLTLQPMGGLSQRGAGVATLVSMAVEHKVFFAQCFYDIKYWLKVFVLDHGRHCCLAGGV